MQTHRLLLAIAAISLATSGVTAASEFQVNTYTTEDQYAPAVAIDDDGNFVVVWISDLSAGTDQEDSSIHGQRFAADGSPISDEFQVNSTTSAGQYLPDLALTPDGGFVVAWYSYSSIGSDQDGTSIQARRFASDGSAIGQDFQINNDTAGDQLAPSLAVAQDGSFVVIWHSDASAFSDQDRNSVHGRLFAADGTPTGPQFQVNTVTTNRQEYGQIAMATDGSFVVTWLSASSEGTDQDDVSVQARRFSTNGAPIGDDFQVNTITLSYQGYPEIAMDQSGAFVIVWESHSSAGDDDNRSAQGRLFASDGAPVGTDFQVNTYTPGFPEYVRAAWLGGGDFIVIWQNGGAENDMDQTSIQGQRFLSDGSPVASQFQLNSLTTGEQERPAVAMDGDGDYVVVWDSETSAGSDTSNTSVQAVRRSFDELIFADGFESGDTLGWSVSNP